jgi:hypothetical protein
MDRIYFIKTATPPKRIDKRIDKRIQNKIDLKNKNHINSILL